MRQYTSVLDLIQALEFQMSSAGLDRVILMDRSSTQTPSHAVAKWFDAYVQGSRASFPLDLFSGAEHVSEFRRQVWNEVSDIPFGETRTYQDIAIAVGNPRAVRAVGTAIGQNPCLIARPCHRVVGSKGSLGGFAFGTPMKQLLLDHEACLA